MPGDDAGFIRLPRSGIDEALSMAWDISRAKSRIPATIRAGMNLREARGQRGYHSLGTRG